MFTEIRCVRSRVEKHTHYPSSQSPSRDGNRIINCPQREAAERCYSIMENWRPPPLVGINIYEPLAAVQVRAQLSCAITCFVFIEWCLSFEPHESRNTPFRPKLMLILRVGFFCCVFHYFYVLLGSSKPALFSSKHK